MCGELRVNTSKLSPPVPGSLNHVWFGESRKKNHPHAAQPVSRSLYLLLLSVKIWDVGCLCCTLEQWWWSANQLRQGVLFYCHSHCISAQLSPRHFHTKSENVLRFGLFTMKHAWQVLCRLWRTLESYEIGNKVGGHEKWWNLDFFCVKSSSLEMKLCKKNVSLFCQCRTMLFERHVEWLDFVHKIFQT